MIIDYKDDRVKKQCTELREARKCFSDKVARKLHMLINFIEAAEDLQSIINNPRYNFHDLKGNKNGLYAMDIDGRKCQYRLIAIFDDFTKEEVFDKKISIQAIEIKEVSKHYE